MVAGYIGPIAKEQIKSVDLLLRTGSPIPQGKSFDFLGREPARPEHVDTAYFCIGQAAAKRCQARIAKAKQQPQSGTGHSPQQHNNLPPQQHRPAPSLSVLLSPPSPPPTPPPSTPLQHLKAQQTKATTFSASILPCIITQNSSPILRACTL